jgi:transposase
MNTKILFIGLDVDDKNFHGYAIYDGDESGTPFKTKANLADLLKTIEKISIKDESVHICYESTYSGFHLCRGLQAAGHECSVIAAGLIPGLANDRVKNDRLDAEKLARYFAKGLLTPVHLPDEDDESNRMLVRSRAFLKEQHKEIKKHMVSLCKQLGWNYRHEFGESASYWTTTHRKWLEDKIKNAPLATKKNFEILLSQFDSIDARIMEYADEIEKISKLPRYKERVNSLLGYRGISILTAMVFILEIGDPKRFAHPKKLISYAGLDIVEYSSGGKEKRFSITKMGNKHIRKILMESVQSAARPAVLSRELKRRREEVDLKYIDVADRCMKRLHKKSLRLLHRGKPANKVKAACAREMLCFVWESLNLAS